MTRGHSDVVFRGSIRITASEDCGTAVSDVRVLAALQLILSLQMAMKFQELKTGGREWWAGTWTLSMYV